MITSNKNSDISITLRFLQHHSKIRLSLRLPHIAQIIIASGFYFLKIIKIPNNLEYMFYIHSITITQLSDQTLTIGRSLVKIAVADGNSKIKYQ